MDSISQIAESPLDTITKALGDARTAKSLHCACQEFTQSSITSSQRKHNLEGTNSSSHAKRARVDPREDNSGSIAISQNNAATEEKLTLPVVLEERLIAAKRVYTNRAPVLLAFAVELIRQTMPEQPASSRLSLAQAVVSLNAKSKAVSLGLKTSGGVEESSWEAGQPRVTIMGRNIPILRRDGYEWPLDGYHESSGLPRLHNDAESPHVRKDVPNPPTWVTSQPISSRGSTFVARAIDVDSVLDGPRLIEELLAAEPALKSATHNSWALRGRRGGAGLQNNTIQDASADDGETGSGAFILRLLEEMHAHGVLVVITRWFGGILLGPDRWKLMRGRVLEALSERTRTCNPSGYDRKIAVWGLHMENGAGQGAGEETAAHGPGFLDMCICRPESALNYLQKSFHSEPLVQGIEGVTRSKGVKASRDIALRDNLAHVIGAIRLLFQSWAPYLTLDQLDRRAWDWYVAVRPQVDAGPNGWGAKGWVKLDDILALRRETQIPDAPRHRGTIIEGTGSN